MWRGNMYLQSLFTSVLFCIFIFPCRVFPQLHKQIQSHHASNSRTAAGRLLTQVATAKPSFEVLFSPWLTWWSCGSSETWGVIILTSGHYFSIFLCYDYAHRTIMTCGAAFVSCGETPDGTWYIRGFRPSCIFIFLCRSDYAYKPS